MIEESLGFQLFRRLYRRIELTEKGTMLSATTTTAFNSIADMIAEISAPDRDEDLSISASVAFSHFWLMPRIASFSRLHPDIQIRIVSQDNNLALGGCDLAIQISSPFGHGRYCTTLRDHRHPDGQSGIAVSVERAIEIYPINELQAAVGLQDVSLAHPFAPLISEYVGNDAPDG